jgi:hypothetical protein
VEAEWRERWESSVKFNDSADGIQGFVFFFGGGGWVCGAGRER